MANRDYALPGFLARWGIYFSERFPPLQAALGLSAFTFATLVYARTVSGQSPVPEAYPFLVGFLVTFLAFLQLRILDEFKDCEEDALYRPERPVPRGLITLKSLGRLWLVAAGLQLALSLTLGFVLVAMLLAVLGYSGLMREEFFARSWLKRRPVAYLGSHMLIIPMLATYVAACAGPTLLLRDLPPYLVFSFLNFCVFEIGRKILAPAEERPGVETYSALWGPLRAVLAWLGAICASAAIGLVAAFHIGVGRTFAATAIVLAFLAAGLATWFLTHLERAKGRLFQMVSALWLLGVHAAMGTAVLAPL